jgi:hypothetical protein
MRWAVHVARIREGRGVYEEIDQWGVQGVVERIILRRIFRKRDVEVWSGLSWLTIERGDGHLLMR